MEYCKNENLPVIVLDIPHVVGLNDTLYYKTVTRAMEDEVKKIPNATYLKFPEKNYSHEFFSESIHYNTKGEKKVNKEFDLHVFPKIVEFSKKHETK